MFLNVLLLFSKTKDELIMKKYNLEAVQLKREHLSL